MRKKILFFSIFLSLFAFANAQRPTVSGILNNVNKLRHSYGLSPLRLSSTIDEIASTHSDEMANGSVDVGHDRFNYRVQLLQQYFRPKAVSENVAYGKMSSAKVVDAWAHSAGHRQNMLGDYNLTGISIARDKEGYYYYTQIFIKK